LVAAGGCAIVSILGQTTNSALRNELDRQHSVPEKLIYLRSVVAEADATLDAASHRKSESLILLGHVCGTNAIEDLVSNVSWTDSSGGWAAARALKEIGKPAVPALLKVFERDDVRAQQGAASVLASTVDGIEQWRKFVDDQKTNMSPSAWNALCSALVVFTTD
jgi:HEAT repeat protein